MKKRNIALAVGGAIGAAVAVKMLTRADTVGWDDVSADVAHSDRSRFVSVDGARIHYQEFGDAADDPVILLHGYTASVYVWKTAAPLIADAGFRVIAIDLLGFGYSEKPAWFDYTIQGQARMVARFMDRMGIGRATIAGSSYGGAVAMTLGLDYAERVERLVLIDAVCNDELKDHPLLKLTSIRGLGEALTPFIADSRSYLRRRMQGTIAPSNHHLITDDRIDAIRRPLLAADGHRSLLATSRNWHADRLERDAHLIKQSTLIIWGEQDTVIPIRNGHKLNQEILNSRLVVLKDCGHIPQEEKAELFSYVLTEFCRESKGRLVKSDGAGQ